VFLFGLVETVDCRADVVHVRKIGGLLLASEYT
jgi:hypothetical protein